MDYLALARELDRAEFAGLTDAEIAAALGAEEIEVERDVDSQEAKNVLRRTGEWGRLVLVARQVVPLDDPLAPLVAAAIVAEDTLTNTTRISAAEGEDWQAMQQVVAALRLGGIISDATAADLLALRTARVNRAARMGFRQMNANEIRAARQAAEERAAQLLATGKEGG